MDTHIIRIAKVLGIPWKSPKWKDGDAWHDDPATYLMLRRMASVMEYMEAEFEIQSETDRSALLLLIRDLHSAFSRRLAQGDKLESIVFPKEILDDYESDTGGRFPPAIVVEKMRKQFDDT